MDPELAAAPGGPPVPVAPLMTLLEAQECLTHIKAHYQDFWRYLKEFHDRQGWGVLGYASFKECIQQEFAFTPRRAYQLLDALEVVTTLASEPGFTPGQLAAITERQARELKPLPPPLRVTIAQQVDFTATPVRELHRIVRRAKAAIVEQRPARVAPPPTPALLAAPLHGALYRGDCRAILPTLPPASVQLVVTSPPFNVQWDYGDGGAGDDLPLAEYQALLAAVFAECQRILRPGGVLAVNLPPSIQTRTPDGQVAQRAYPSAGWAALHLLEHGWLPREERTWVKMRPNTAGYATTTAIGNYCNPHPRHCTERIIEVSNGQYQITGRGPRWPGTEAEWGSYLELCKDVWFLEPGRARRGEPLAFPDELVRRLLYLYSNAGDVVLDPFAGTGTVGRVARAHDREAWLIEQNPAYWPRCEAVLRGTPGNGPRGDPDGL
jgi:site-specific DNA-methyltransferase (adenine-specific)